MFPVAKNFISDDDNSGIPPAFDEFDGMDMNIIDDFILENCSSLQDYSKCHALADLESFIYEPTSHNDLTPQDADPTDYDSDNRAHASDSNKVSFDIETEGLEPMMKLSTFNTLNMLRDEIPFGNGNTVNFPLRSNKPKEHLDFKQLDENPFKKLGVRDSNTLGPVVIVLMHDFSNQWTNALTPKLLNKLVDQPIQPVVFTLYENYSRRFIIDFLKKVKRLKRNFLSRVDLEGTSGKNKVIRYLIMNVLAKILKSWTLNLLIIDTNPYGVIRNNWIVEYANLSSLPLVHVSSFLDTEHDQQVIQKAYEKISRFIKAHNMSVPRSYIFKNSDGYIYTTFDNPRSNRSSWNLTKDVDLHCDLLNVDKAIKGACGIGITGKENDEDLIAHLKERMKKYTIGKHTHSSSNSSMFSELHCILKKNVPKIVPKIYEEPEKLIKFIMGQCGQRFFEAVAKAYGGYLTESNVHFKQNLRFIIVIEGCNPVLELLTTALWFWDNCALATCQKRYCPSIDMLHMSYNSIKTRFAELNEEKDSIFNVWLSEGIRHIIRSCESKCILVDLPRPGGFSEKEFRFLVSNQFSSGASNIKTFFINSDNLDLSVKGNNTLNIVERILDRLQYYLRGDEQTDFASARTTYRELLIDRHYSSLAPETENDNENCKYFLSLQKRFKILW